MLSMLAQATELVQVAPQHSVWRNFGVSIMFGIIGVLLLSGGIKFLDIVVERKIDFVKELTGDNKEGKPNIAVAIYMGAFLLALGYIIGQVVA